MKWLALPIGALCWVLCAGGDLLTAQAATPQKAAPATIGSEIALGRVEPGRPSPSLLPAMQMLDEDGPPLTLTQALQASGWHAASAGNSFLRHNTGRFWLRGWLTQAGPTGSPVWLAMGHARVERLEAWLLLPDGQVGSYQAAGIAVPLQARTVRSLSPVFIFDVPAGERRQVLFRVHNESVVDVDAALWRAQDYQQSEIGAMGWDLLISGIAFGLVGMMLVVGGTRQSRALIGWVLAQQAYVWTTHGLLMRLFPGLSGSPVVLLKLSAVLGLAYFFLELSRVPLQLDRDRLPRALLHVGQGTVLLCLVMLPLLGLHAAHALAVRLSLVLLMAWPLALLRIWTGRLPWRGKGGTALRYLMLIWGFCCSEFLLYVSVGGEMSARGRGLLTHTGTVLVYALLFVGQWRAYRHEQKQAEQQRQAVAAQALAQLQQGVDERTHELNLALESSATALLRVAASEQRLEAILGTAVDGILYLRSDGTVELANEAAARLLDVAPAELQGSSLFDHLCCPEDPAVLASLQATMSVRIRAAVELEHDFNSRHAVGAPRWLRLAINPNLLRQADRYVCVISDVTPRRQLQDRLMAKRQRMSAAVENNQITTWELNLETGQLEINEAFARQLGYAVAELLPGTLESVRALIHPDDRAGMRSSFEPLYRGDVASVVAAMRMRRRDGSYCWVRSSGTVVSRNPQGQPHLIFGTIVDISELVEAREAAERTLRSKDAFVATMTHELRTPLNSILGFSQMLEADPALDADQQENVAYILQATRHLIYLVNQTLDLARLESGHLQARCEVIHLQEACGQGEQMILPAAAERRIRVVNQCATDVLALGDPQLVKQILLNLLSNAVKYNREGGSIILQCGAEPDGQVWVSVSDTGRGVRSEDFEALFEPFVRLEGEDARTEGSGIGLAISRDLARLMAGQLEVSSQPDVGSTFRLLLPPPPADLLRAVG